MRWIDTHCHLDAQEFSPLAQQVRAQAAINNVAICVIPAVDPGNFGVVRTLAHTLGDSYCLGIHPLYVAQAGEDALAQLAVALQQHHDDPRLVAVGEIGLDYFVPALCASPLRERQQHFFVAQLKLARQHDLPVVLHSRRSVDRLLQGLREVGGKTGQWCGIAHAFSGSVQQAQAFIALGFKLGFGGALTYERATNLRELAAGLPLDSIVLETDAPDMPPHWLYKTAEQRGAGEKQGINSPAELPRIGAELAALRGINVEELAAATCRNAQAALPKLGALLESAGQARQENPSTRPSGLQPSGHLMTQPTPSTLTEAQAISQILQHCRTVAVVGLSPKAHRESFMVSQYMQARGWRIVPVNPVAAASGELILGEKVYATLVDAAAHEKIDLVNVFRNSEDVPAVVDDALAAGLPALWLQLGIGNDAALARAQAAGMVAVQNRCLKIEHARRG